MLIDRSPFLQRGLLPLAALASTVPLVGIAPIMVMWFGFDWHVEGRGRRHDDLLPDAREHARRPGRIGPHGARPDALVRRELLAHALVALRIPVALPFVFNALKINSTLAMIGAIVAEFFGSPTVGLGFRISTEAARLNMGLVWAAIVVAALAGSLLYGCSAGSSGAPTFWHPSIRANG